VWQRAQPTVDTSTNTHRLHPPAASALPHRPSIHRTFERITLRSERLELGIRQGLLCCAELTVLPRRRRHRPHARVGRPNLLAVFTDRKSFDSDMLRAVAKMDDGDSGLEELWQRSSTKMCMSSVSAEAYQVLR
jgi:hypothetical protein